MRFSSMPVTRSPALQDRATRSKTEPDQRRNVRFPLALPVRYRLAKGSGWGQTINIGSGGALFTIDQPVKIGQRVELFIGWPVLLHENVHLNLVAGGSIVRVEAGCAAVKFEHCHFRTASAASRRKAAPAELSARAESQG
jgi:hypothetical protein